MEPRAGFEPAISCSLAPTAGGYQADALAGLSHRGAVQSGANITAFRPSILIFPSSLRIISRRRPARGEEGAYEGLRISRSRPLILPSDALGAVSSIYMRRGAMSTRGRPSGSSGTQPQAQATLNDHRTNIADPPPQPPEINRPPDSAPERGDEQTSDSDLRGCKTAPCVYIQNTIGAG